MAAVAIQSRRLTRAEYHRAAEAGVYRPDERLELIGGEVIEKVSPQKRAHAISVTSTAEALREAFSAETGRFHIQEEKPLIVSDDSEPEPDVTVIYGALRDYKNHPTGRDTALVAEVSDTSLPFDVATKASLYAAAEIPEYWVLNLNRRRLEVRREPMPDADAPFGFAYRSLRIYTEEEGVTPLAVPNAILRVADLLPPEADTTER